MRLNMEETIKNDIKQLLSEERYEHSIRTSIKAVELAKRWNENEKIAEITALAHDMAKEMTKEQYIEYAKKHEINLSKEDILIGVNLHGIIAAKMCKEKYGFSEEMCSAISYHTTGRVNMTLLDKIIYVADKIEDGREYEGIEELRKLAFIDLDEVILQIINYNIQKSIKQEKYIHSLSVMARNEIMKNKKK